MEGVDAMKIDEKYKEPIRQALLDGASYRGIAGVMHCDKDTVSKFVAKYLPELQRKPVRKQPEPDKNLLIIDIETRPALAYVWDVWNVNIYPQQIVEDKAMLSFAAKWHGSKHPMMFASDFHTGHDKMVNMAHVLLDQADAVIHYNGYKFDVPHIQQEFVLAGLPPCDFYQIDLLKTMRTEFNFTSNKLDNIIKQFGIGKKVEHEGFALWTKCLAGDAKAWEKMQRYNTNDTRKTEELFDRLLPWVKAPNYPRKRLVNSKFWLPNV
jgi:hypothetical protein